MFMLLLATMFSAPAHATAPAFCTSKPIALVRDADGDGYNGTPLWFCPTSFLPPRAEGWVSLASVHGTTPDCDDHDAAINPDASDVYDGADNDCNGIVDDTEYYDGDGDGYTAVEDCNDADATVFPDATEICDAVDNNCDSSVDEGATDTDGDGTCDDIDADPYPTCDTTWSFVTEIDTSKVDFPGVSFWGDDADNACDGGVNTISVCTDDASLYVAPDVADVASYVEEIVADGTNPLVDNTGLECTTAIVTELTSSNPDCAQVQVEWGCE